MRIRPATEVDLDEIVDLRVAFIADVRGERVEELSDDFRTATDAYVRQGTVEGRLRTWLATTDDGQRAGVVSVVVTDAPPLPDELRTKEGYVVNMYVLPDHRGRGLARALLHTIIDESPALGIRSLHLYATDAGLPLYEATGFARNDRFLALPLPHPAEVRT